MVIWFEAVLLLGRASYMARDQGHGWKPHKY
jgi:hypothetical protein